MTGNGMTRKLSVLIRAKYPVMVVVSREEHRVEAAVKAVAQSLKPPFRTRTWSCTQGVLDVDGTVTPLATDARDPADVLQFVQSNTDRALYVLRDFHHYWSDPAVQRGLRDAVRSLKRQPPTQARALILLSPTLGERGLPAELEADVHQLEWSLPTREELGQVLEAAMAAVPDAVRAGMETVDREAVVSAALGLTAEEAHSAFARSIVERGTLEPAVIMAEKKQIVNKSRGLEWMDSLPGGLDAVGGLEVLKEWIESRKAAFTREAREYGLPRVRGILLGGVSGCGKTLSAKAIAAALQQPLLRFSVSRVYGSLQGQTEEALRKVFEVAETVAPCVLVVDEIDKAVGSGTSVNESDNRVKGELLTWLQECKSEVFVCASANNLEVLAERSPELLRKGRFDELFFVDLPHQEERAEILSLHLRQRGQAVETPEELVHLAAATTGFSGAELEAVVIDAMFRAFGDGRRPVMSADVLAAIKATTPLSKSAHGRIEALRQWAAGKMRPASRPRRAEGAEGGGPVIEVDEP